MKKLKIGVIGCGGITTWGHEPYLGKMENVEFVTFCDIIEDRAIKFAKKYDAKHCTDYMDILNDKDIDAVDICTPNYLHSEIAVKALKANKHVFCEKPDAISSAEVNRMYMAYKESNKVLMVMRNNRYLPASVFVKKQIDNNEFGNIYAARCGWRRRRGIPGKGGWFTTKEQSGGGPLIDLGVHMIDLAIWLMGNPKPISVSGSTFNAFAKDTSLADSEHAAYGDKVEDGIFDVEDLAMGFIKFDNGACLQLEFSWASNIEKEHRFVQVYGDKAGCRWEDGDVTVYKELHGEQVDIKPKINKGIIGHEKNLEHFVDVVLNGTTPGFLPEQGVHMIKILEAIYKSAKTNKEVLL